MLTALSNGVLIPRKLAELGIAAKAACKIIGIPPSRLNLCVSGIQDLSPQDAAKLHGLCHRLAAIQNAFQVPLDFSNADKWSALLEHLQDVDIDALASAIERIFNRS
jgi:hypothetical protein